MSDRDIVKLSDRIEGLQEEVGALQDELEVLKDHIARLQDVKQCEDCLKLLAPAAYSEHQCHPVHANPWRKS